MDYITATTREFNTAGLCVKETVRKYTEEPPPSGDDLCGALNVGLQHSCGLFRRHDGPHQTWGGGFGVVSWNR